MVKRKGNLMPELCSLRNVILADCNARKGKIKSRKYIELHDKNLLEEDKALCQSLSSLSYKTSKYSLFKIYEPKERIIYKLPYYPDRIAHHSIMNVVKDIWNNQFIPNTYSCIKGRGIHKCLRDLKRDLWRTRNTGETTYCLKLDITKFYPSIDHTILKEIISRKIKDSKVLNIIFEIIDSTNNVEGENLGKGIPIGNYLSQYFANLYLSRFDHWCKEELKCRFYYRYADDIVILESSKDRLRTILIVIKLYLRHVLKLSIKGNYQIFPIESRGIDFVGYVFRHKYIKIRKGIKVRCKKKLLNLSLSRANIVYQSYKGWFYHCDATNLMRTLQNYIIMACKGKGKGKGKKGK